MRVTWPVNRTCIDCDGVSAATRRLQNTVDGVVSRTRQNFLIPELREMRKHTSATTFFDNDTQTAHLDVLSDEGVLGVQQILDDGDVREKLYQVAYQAPLQISIYAGPKVNIGFSGAYYFNRAARN